MFQESTTGLDRRKMIQTVIMIGVIPMAAVAAGSDNHWDTFDPFSLEVVASENNSIKAESQNTPISVQPLTARSVLTVSELEAVPELISSTQENGILRTPPLHIPVTPELLSPYRPWGCWD